MATPRKPVQPTTEAVDNFWARFSELFCRRAAAAAPLLARCALGLRRAQLAALAGVAGALGACSPRWRRPD